MRAGCNPYAWAVRRAYRRRKGEARTTANSIEDGDFGTKAQPRFPYIPVSLYMGAIAIAARQGIDTLFVLTEPRLASHFAKLGVRITRIGGPIEHRGTRIPSMIDVRDVIDNMRLLMRPLWRSRWLFPGDCSPGRALPVLRRIWPHRSGQSGSTIRRMR